MENTFLLLPEQNTQSNHSDGIYVTHASNFNGMNHNGYVIITDPLQLSPEESLLFPANAAKTLANLRSKRYDSEFISLDDAEIRLRNLASIMGMIPWDGDQPDAA